MTTPSPVLSTPPPRLHVTANLPPVIYFSSIDEPQLQVRMNFEYSQPIIIVLKESLLWPLHLRSALTLHNTSSGQQEYLPHVDASFRNVPIPPLDIEHKDEFLGLKPGQSSVVSVSFWPYDEPYEYEKMNDCGVERYKILFPIRMQFLSVRGCYKIGIQGDCTEAYMLGDLDVIVREGKSEEWAPAGDLVEVVRGEKMQVLCYR